MRHEEADTFDKFLFTLEWLLEISARYNEPFPFSLIHIDFGNPQILGDAYGAQDASLKLQEAFRLLRQMLRKTDLAARQGVDFWIITPHVGPLETLPEKLAQLIELTSRSGLHIVERDIAVFPLSHRFPEMGPGHSATDFLAYLKHNRHRLSQREVVLPPSD